VRLEEVGPSETILRYDVKAQVGGKMAQLGGRLIDSTANQMAGLFFDRLQAQLTPTMPPASGLATPAPVSHKFIPIAGAMPARLMGIPLPILLGGGAMLLVLYLIFLSS
jgi:hypothetical protein